MTPETPHRCAIWRSTRTNGKYAAPAVVSTENPCMIVPATSKTVQSFAGNIEMVDSMLFIGFDVDVQMNDEIYDEGKDEWWVVTERPLKYDNPSTWEPDHQQCVIARKGIQA